MSGMKKILWLLAAVLCIIPAVVSAQSPTTREYPYLYKSPRAMGMGGAYTAVGGRTDALFYNPAALINIPQDKGWDVSLLQVTGDVGKNSVDFVKDMQDALDTPDGPDADTDPGNDQEKAVNEILARYRGRNLHLGLETQGLLVIPAMSKSTGTSAFGISPVSNLRMDMMPHDGLSSAGLLEVNADLTFGGIVGFSFGVSENVFLGLSTKFLHRDQVIHNFTARELVEHQDDLDDYITDNLVKSGNAVGFDSGIIWKLAPESLWRPSVGVSVMNIGDLDFKEAGTLPMTVNAGFAVNPQITWFRSLILAADYVDILNNYEQDNDMMKRLRYGAELQLFDVWPIEMALRAGMYQGYPTAGVDLRLLTFTITGVMYSEEVGAYAGQDRDKRYMVSFNFGW